METYQSVHLRFLKVILPIQRIEPHIKEESRKVALSKHKASGVQVLVIRADYKVDILWLQVRESLDNAVRRHNGNVLEHQRLKAILVKDMRL